MAEGPSSRAEYTLLRRRAILVTLGLMVVVVAVGIWTLVEARSTGSPLVWMLLFGCIVAIALGVRALAAEIRRKSPPDI